jgi:hypothetical protein
MPVFNSTLFNKAIFNTKFIASGGVSKRKFRKLPKQLMFSQTTLKASSNIVIPVSLKFESKVSGDITSNVKSSVSFNDSITILSKLSHEFNKPINSSISKGIDITVKGNINVMELNSNKMVKYNTIQNILSLID